MSEELQQLNAIREHIDTLPLEVRAAVHRVADVYRLVMAIEPQAGEMAFALVGAEMAARP